MDNFEFKTKMDALNLLIQSYFASFPDSGYPESMEFIEKNIQGLDMDFVRNKVYSYYLDLVDQHSAMEEQFQQNNEVVEEKSIIRANTDNVFRVTPENIRHLVARDLGVDPEKLEISYQIESDDPTTSIQDMIIIVHED